MKIFSVILMALVSVFSRAPAAESISADSYPQSVLFDVVTDHLSEQTDDVRKKLLFIGYDGFRADCLPVITSDGVGAVSRVASEGCLISTYAGGTAEAPQQTSTAAGWCSILTGKGAAESGVWNNKSVKRDSAETFLTAAVKMGYSCAFVSSYPSHYENTLIRDIKRAKKEDLGINYIRTADDTETKDTALSLIEGGKYDVVFVIFEYTDAAGHKYGFSAEEEPYREACITADKAGAELLDAVAKSDSITDDRLVVITTDHGGIGRRHGGQSESERSTWAAVNKPFEGLLK